MTPELLDAVRSHHREDGEACGVFVLTRPNYADFFPCRNMVLSGDHTFFDPHDLARAEDRGPIIGYAHTHTEGCIPSPVDMIDCARSRKPWWIVDKTDFYRINPGVPLSGRRFVWGLQDCYTLIRDWFAVNDIIIPDFERSPDFWKAGVDPYMAGLTIAGFELVPEEPGYGDVILMAIESKYGIPNHGAVHIGNGHLIHHLPNRLSMVELYDGIYQSKTVAVARRIK